jgi:transposase
VKNDFRDAADLADLLRLGRLPEGWIAPPEVRELRELVRHRAKLVAIRSGWKCQVHAVVATCGIPVRMSDLFGAAGTQLLDRLTLAVAFRARVNSLRRLLDAVEAEIDLFSGMVGARLAPDPGYRAIQAIDGVGPVLASVLVAEIGDVTRFPGPAQLASWVGLTPPIMSPTPTCAAARSPSRLPAGPLGGSGGRADGRHPHPAGVRPRPGRSTPRRAPSAWWRPPAS